METGEIKESGGGIRMKYWQKIDLVTIKRMLDDLNEVANEIEDQKMPIDELMDFSVMKIDQVIDELSWYYSKGLQEKEER